MRSPEDGPRSASWIGKVKICGVGCGISSLQVHRKLQTSTHACSQHLPELGIPTIRCFQGLAVPRTDSISKAPNRKEPSEDARRYRLQAHTISNRLLSGTRENGRKAGLFGP